MARDHVEAAGDDQQPVRQRLLHAQDERDRGQRRQHRTQGHNPGQCQHDAENHRGTQTDRPGQREQHAEPRRGGFAAGEVQPDRTAMPQQHGKSGQTHGPGHDGLRNKPRRGHQKRQCTEPFGKDDRRDTLQHIDQQHRQSRPFAKRAQHIGCARGPGAMLAYIDALEQFARQIARGRRTQEIGDRQSGHARYPETHGIYPVADQLPRTYIGRVGKGRVGLVSPTPFASEVLRKGKLWSPASCIGSPRRTADACVHLFVRVVLEPTNRSGRTPTKE